jgi:hypothetical protein
MLIWCAAKGLGVGLPQGLLRPARARVALSGRAPPTLAHNRPPERCALPARRPTEAARGWPIFMAVRTPRQPG